MKKSKILFLTLLIVFVCAFFYSCNSLSKNDNEKNKENEKIENTVTISEKNVNLVLGETYVLRANSNLNTDELVWNSSDSSVVSCNKGEIIALKIGTATIEVKAGDVSDTCVVKVGFGEGLPYLKLNTSLSDINLAYGQSFDLSVKLLFNEVEYKNFTYSIECDDEFLDYQINNSSIKINAIKSSDVAQTFIIKAEWCGVTYTDYPSLSKTLNITISDDFYFNINNKGVEDVNLYTISSLDGNSYETSYTYNVDAFFNGEKIESPEITVTIDNENIASKNENVIFAVNEGVATCTLLCTYNGKDYVKEFKINVKLPTVEKEDNEIRFYSAQNGVLDLSNLDFSLTDVKYFEINDKRYDVSNGKLPEITIKQSTKNIDYFYHTSNYTIDLEIEDQDKPITLNYINANNLFDSVKFVLYLKTGYVYTLNNVKVCSKVLASNDDLQSFFGTRGKIDGYYVLANNIDASTIDLTNAKRTESDAFVGLFDGQGYSIYNIDISSTGVKGSLFGKLDANATVMNLALVNVTANGSSVIASSATYNGTSFGGYPSPLIENVYVKVDNSTTDFYGIVGGGPSYQSGHINLKNVIVEYAGEITGDDTSKAKGALLGYTDYLTPTSVVANNAYLISNEYITTKNNAEAYLGSNITRYANIDAMKSVVNDYSSFSETYWDLTSGIPTWKGLTDIIFPIVDNTLRNYEIDSNIIDLSGLDIDLIDITAIEISGTKINITNGVFPTFALVNSTRNISNFTHKEEYTLGLSGNGISIDIPYSTSTNSFDSIVVKLYTDTDTYILNNVSVFSKVLTTVDDLNNLFTTTGKIDGYYVLGNNIDASTATLTGTKRSTSDKFTGIFNGQGYTIYNLDVSTSSGAMGSLFGGLEANASVMNVALVNVTANGSAVIASQAAYNGTSYSDYPAPMIKDVYVQVNEDTTDFYGIVGGGPNYGSGHINLKNVIVEYAGEITGDDTSKAKGALLGYINDEMNATSVVANNAYLISNEYITTKNNAEAYLGLNITRYASVDAMKSATNDYSAFNTSYWSLTNGIPTWSNMEGVVLPVKDTTERTFDLSSKSLDITGLGIIANDIKSIEINNVVFAVENGVLPTLSLENIDGTKFNLIGTNLVYEIAYNDGEISSITIKVVTEDNLIILKNVKVYSQIIDSASELETLFSSTVELKGFYVLGSNIDASEIDLTNAKRKDNVFTGIFDGRGYTISNLDISDNEGVNGSLFGKIKYPAEIKNVAFYNVKADNAAVLSSESLGNVDWTDSSNPKARTPVLSNIYIKIKEGTADFRGIVTAVEANQKLPTISNVFVEALRTNHTKSEDIGSFFGTSAMMNACCVANQKGDFTDNYVISDIKLNHYWGLSEYSGVNYDATEGIVRYDTFAAMKSATNDYSSFSETCWDLTSGIPTWKTCYVFDNTSRIFEVEDKELDISDLEITVSDIKSISINEVVFNIEDNELPALTLSNVKVKSTESAKLVLTGTGLSYSIPVTDGVPSEISITIYTNDKVIVLNKVTVCSKVITTASELQTIFSKTADIDGYYVLGNNIDASTATLTGSIRKDSKFKGIFDGKGYTISNLDISATSKQIGAANANCGSLFGKIINPAIIQNVGFYNVVANNAAVISSQLLGEADWDTDGYPALVPTIKNVYVKVKDGVQNFRGIIATIETQYITLPKIENVIVEVLDFEFESDNADNNGSFGSYFGSDWFNGRKETATFANNYAISTLHVHQYWGLHDNFTGITRYDTVDAMKSATNDYSSFSETYWDLTSGIPTWESIPKED